MIKFLSKYSFFLAYIISYPVQVFTLGEMSGLFGLFIAISFLLLLLNIFSVRGPLKIDKKTIFIINIMAILPISYLISYYVNPDEYYSSILFKTLVLFILFVVLLFPRNLSLFISNIHTKSLNIYKPGLFTSWVIFGIPISIMLLAAIKNSLGALPQGVVLNDKYFYGPFIRAGAGFVDPNALGIMTIITFSIFFEYFSRYRSLLIFSSLAIFALAAITFSRTSQILYIVFFIFKIVKHLNKADIALMTFFFIAILSYLFYQNFEVIYVFFERYFNEEGQSSSGDRLNQINVLLEIISNINLKGLLFGIGGQEAFQRVSGSAMHSAPLSIFIDAGILPSIAVFLFFGISIIQSLKKPFNLFQIVAVLTCFVLPYIPELFFLLCIYFVIENKNRSIFIHKIKYGYY